MRTRANLVIELGQFISTAHFRSPGPYWLIVRDNKFMILNSAIKPNEKELICQYQYSWKYCGPPVGKWIEIDGILKTMWEEGILCQE